MEQQHLPPEATGYSPQPLDTFPHAQRWTDEEAISADRSAEQTEQFEEIGVALSQEPNCFDAIFCMAW